MLNSLASAIKAKSPIVAIPIEGQAPLCIHRKRLAAWCKGVMILNVTVDSARRLVVTGRAGSVKTTARFVSIDRRTAVKTISVWSEKERERRLKKILLGALSPEQKKSFKMAAHEGTGDGIPVSIPELPELSFTLILEGAVYKVIERSKKTAGVGNTPEAAIVDARKSAMSATVEMRARVTAECLREYAAQ